MPATSLPQLPDTPLPLDAETLLLGLPGGNTGDALIRQGSERFLRDSRISVWSSDGTLELAAAHGDLGRFGDPLASYRGDVIFVGGGNIGIYADNARMRARVIAAARSARGFLVLPQSARAAEPALTDPRVVVWARDARSQTVLDEAGIATRLVPDAAFAMADAVPTTPGGEGTYFVLRDPGHCEEWLAPPVEVDGPNSDLTWRAPLAEVVATLEPHRFVVSNRLHGGIVSMMMGKRTAFLPVAYHKIVSFYETWLADDPGVAFVDSPEALDRFREGTQPPSSDLAAMFLDRAGPALAAFRSGRAP